MAEIEPGRFHVALEPEAERAAAGASGALGTRARGEPLPNFAEAALPWLFPLALPHPKPLILAFPTSASTSPGLLSSTPSLMRAQERESRNFPLHHESRQPHRRPGDPDPLSAPLPPRTHRGDPRRRGNASGSTRLSPGPASQPPARLAGGSCPRAPRSLPATALPSAAGDPPRAATANFALNTAPALSSPPGGRQEAPGITGAPARTSCALEGARMEGRRGLLLALFFPEQLRETYEGPSPARSGAGIWECGENTANGIAFFCCSQPNEQDFHIPSSRTAEAALGEAATPRPARRPPRRRWGCGNSSGRLRLSPPAPQFWGATCTLTLDKVSRSRLVSL